MATVIPAQPDDVRAVIVAAMVFLICCICVALMMKSKRPDRKMLFLLGLISAGKRHSRKKRLGSVAPRLGPGS